MFTIIKEIPVYGVDVNFSMTWMLIVTAIFGILSVIIPHIWKTSDKNLVLYVIISGVVTIGILIGIMIYANNHLILYDETRYKISASDELVDFCNTYDVISIDGNEMVIKLKEE